MKMDQTQRFFSLTVFFLIGFMMGCGGDGNEPCSPLDATCSREANTDISIIDDKSTVYNDETFTVDASDSIYDELSYTLNGEPVGACKNQDECVFTITTAGNYEVKVKTKVLATNGFFLGMTGGSESEDEDSVGVTVLARETSSGTVTETTCANAMAAVGSSYQLLTESNGKCVIMNKSSDDAACRSGSYTNCVFYAGAVSACSSKAAIAGSSWSVPTISELGLMHSYLGSGSVDTSNGFCRGDGTTDPCKNNGVSPWPIDYWSQTLSSSSIRKIVRFSVEGSNYVEGTKAESNTKGSVRCVAHIDPQ